MSAEDVMKATIKRTKFLIDHPELLPVQEEIDNALKKAGKNPMNRCVVLQTMLIDEAKKLNKINSQMFEDIRKLGEATKEGGYT